MVGEAKRCKAVGDETEAAECGKAMKVSTNRNRSAVVNRV
jgi:hypothetical protein